MPASWINPLVPLAWELLQHLQVGSVGSELCPAEQGRGSRVWDPTGEKCGAGRGER